MFMDIKFINLSIVTFYVTSYENLILTKIFLFFLLYLTSYLFNNNHYNKNVHNVIIILKKSKLGYSTQIAPKMYFLSQKRSILIPNKYKIVIHLFRQVHCKKMFKSCLNMAEIFTRIQCNMFATQILGNISAIFRNHLENDQSDT